jgi:hypothetical protein
VITLDILIIEHLCSCQSQERFFTMKKIKDHKEQKRFNLRKEGKKNHHKSNPINHTIFIRNYCNYTCIFSGYTRNTHTSFVGLWHPIKSQKYGQTPSHNLFSPPPSLWPTNFSFVPYIIIFITWFGDDMVSQIRTGVHHGQVSTSKIGDVTKCCQWNRPHQ